MRTLRVGIDGYNLALPNGTGVATYGYTLAKVLRGRGHAVEGVFGIDPGPDADIRDVRFFETLGKPRDLTPAQQQRERARLRRHALLPLASARCRDVPLSGAVDLAPLSDTFPQFTRLVTSPRLFDVAIRHFRNYGRMLPVHMADPPPIMHWTYPVPARMVGARNIYTLHDLVPLRLPYTTLEAKRGYHRLFRKIAAEADHVVTVSETSRRDILDLSGIAEDRVTNTWQASSMPDDTLTRDPGEDACVVRNIFGLEPQSYFLFFGAMEPKKNVGRLLEAFLALDTVTPLVLVGGRGWQNERELHLLNHAPGAGPNEVADERRRVIRLEHLSRPLLLRLIRGARAALFPSISEGFGLPVLEAMQLGTPVLTSSISALPEVAGDAALIVDPYDVDAIGKALAELDTDAMLRERLARAGPARASFFTPERYADRLEAMYTCILDRAHVSG